MSENESERTNASEGSGSPEAADKTAEGFGSEVGKGLVAGLGRIFGRPADVVAAMLERELAYWKWRHGLWIVERAQQVLESRGKAGPDRRISVPAGLKMIEEAAYVDDDGLREKWANLLANATDAAVDVEIRPAFVDILAGLSPFDAKILDMIAHVDVADTLGVWTGGLPEIAEPAQEGDREQRPGPRDDVAVALSNLVRLGCLLPSAAWGGSLTGKLVRITPLGEEFVRACSESPSARPGPAAP